MMLLFVMLFTVLSLFKASRGYCNREKAEVFCPVFFPPSPVSGLSDSDDAQCPAE